MKKTYLFLAFFLAVLGGGGSNQELKAAVTNVTFKFVDAAGVQQSTCTASLEEGATITAPIYPFITISSYRSKNTGGTIDLTSYKAQANDEITVTYTSLVYQFSNNTRNNTVKYLYCDDTRVCANATVNTELASCWTFIPATLAGKVFLKNKATQAYIGSIINGDERKPTCTTTTPSVPLEILQKSGGTTYSVNSGTPDGKNSLHLDGSSNIVGWTAVDNSSQWSITPIDVSYLVSYQCVESSGADIKTISKIENSANHTIAPPAIGGCTVGTITYNGATVTEGSSITIGPDAIVKVTYNLPFKTTTVGNAAEFPSDANWYMLSLHGKHMKYNGTVPTINSTIRPAKKTDIVDSDLWCFEGSYVTGFKIYNKATGVSKVFGGSTPFTMVAKIEADVWTMDKNTNSENPNGGVGITLRKGLTGNSYLNDLSGGSVLSIWSDDGALNDFGSKLQFASYDDIMNRMTITYKYTCNGIIVKTKEEVYAKGSSYTAPAIGLYTIPTPVTGTANADDEVIVVCTANYPFMLSSDVTNGQFATDTHWYKLKVRDGFLCKYKVSTPSYIETTSLNNSIEDAYLWCVTGSLTTGFKIYNRAAGALKPLISAASGDPTFGTPTTDNSFWDMIEGKYTQSFGFTPKGTNSTRGALNHNKNNNKIAHWKGGFDEGSSFLALDVLIDAKKSVDAYVSTIGFVGGYSAADVADLQAAKNLYVATPNETNLTLFLAAQSAMSSKTAIPMKSGAYYRVYNTNKKGYLTNNIDKFVGNGSLDGQSLSQIWLFTETGPSSGLYKISCGTDYIASITGVAFNVQVPKVQESAAGLYKVISKGLGGFGLLQNGQAENSHFYLHSNSGNLLRWEAGASAPDGSIWSLKEVPTLNVTVPNGIGYATVSAMYPMIIPTGVEAYYAGEAVANSKLKLTKISDGVIPANQGVILYSQTAKDATASISYPFSSTEGVAGTPITNQLSNTAAGPQTGGVNDYVLYKGNQGLGFYKGRGTSQIPANKAYLSLTGGPASLLFEGDELTAIDGMLTIDKASDGKYYNLGGVEVPNPVKGCIYLHNGKAIVK